MNHYITPRGDDVVFTIDYRHVRWGMRFRKIRRAFAALRAFLNCDTV